MRALSAAAVAALGALGACRATSNGWAEGDYHVLHESDELQLRASRARIEPDGEHVFLHWVGARSKPGEPWIEEFLVVVFDDANGDGFPQQTEVLESKTTTERTTKVLVSGIVVPLTDRPEALKGWARARTSRRTESGLWRVLDR